METLTTSTFVEIVILILLALLVLKLVGNMSSTINKSRNNFLFQRLQRELNLQFDFVQVNVREGDTSLPLMLLTNSGEDGLKSPKALEERIPTRHLKEFSVFIEYVCRLGSHIQKTGLLYGVVVSVVPEDSGRVLHLTILKDVYFRYIADQFMRRVR